MKYFDQLEREYNQELDDTDTYTCNECLETYELSELNEGCCGICNERLESKWENDFARVNKTL